MKKIAIAGMGLIGGSFYKASVAAGYEVAALHHGDVDGVEDADLVLVCLPPDAIVPWILERSSLFKSGALIVDICGVKREILSRMRSSGPRLWKFVGGHPMAGREVSGFENSLPTLFEGASMIITPPPDITGEEIERLRIFFGKVGFVETVVTDALHHDEMIAFTSQLCHIIATSYARDGRVGEACGFSAGSYANMTRIATQDSAVWSSLYRMNRDRLLPVIDAFIARIGELRDALAAGDDDGVRRMIEEGAKAKRDEILSRKRGDENV